MPSTQVGFVTTRLGGGGDAAVGDERTLTRLLLRARRHQWAHRHLESLDSRAQQMPLYRGTEAQEDLRHWDQERFGSPLPIRW